MHYRSAFAQRGDDLLPDEDLSIVTWCNRLLRTATIFGGQTNAIRSVRIHLPDSIGRI
jgi:hypothetical protein